MEILLSGMDEANNVISDFEIKLASFNELPSDIERLNHVSFSPMFCLLLILLKVFYIKFLKTIENVGTLLVI